MLSDQRRRKGYKRRTAKTFRSLGQTAQGVLLHMPKQNTIIHDRLIETARLLGETDQDVTFQHSVLCQTCLPYRDPGDDVRTWERLNGSAHLKVLAGEAMHPELRRLVPLGLPFGPKPRMVLAHINAEALRSNSPEIEIADSCSGAQSKCGKRAIDGRFRRTLRETEASLKPTLLET